MATQVRSSAHLRIAAFARALVVAAVVIGLDQLTKHVIADNIGFDEQHQLIPGVLKLVHDQNTGVAFSLFSGGGTLVLVLTFAALSVLVGYLAVRPDRSLLWVPTGMLLGGALGNLIDRIAYGAVTDWIKLPHWPAFNVSDISITLGVLVLLWVLEFRRPDRR